MVFFRWYDFLVNKTPSQIITTVQLGDSKIFDYFSTTAFYLFIFNK